MPQEVVREAAKVVVETSGIFSSAWQWLVSGIGAGVIGLWGHVTGRIKKLEETLATSTELRDHIEDENAKFDALFKKHEHTLDEVTAIGKAVARIEGKLSVNNDWQNQKG